MVRAKLRMLRKQRGITQTFISGKLGFKHPSGYSNIENGRNGLSLEHAKIISDILGVPLEELTEDAKETFLSA
ncbi:XRE family transcriptional regulator [Paenibacillus sambharensis]|uniref:XRE family transcriptional regulator n=1 Tax=Paenibacillus sambharensis TaxID=1803190 RepID=A0A2W1L8P6_9BACL|nr:helix-turn-helix transcriptional regulator [Paenibacillus sambharensis]PZD95199.1 XRE family transcriptional regulator [Paenibacillus sambharensis]